MFDDLVRRSRSYRRFDQETSIGMNTLRELVDITTLSVLAWMTELQAIEIL